MTIDKDSTFINMYIDESVRGLLRLDPSLDKIEIRKFVEKECEKEFQNPDVILDNNYTNETKNGTLLSVVDWTFNHKPILAGNGTMFRNKNQAVNPKARMLQDILIDRKTIKAEMFTKIPGSPQYKTLDISQGNKKRNANSYYGGTGAKSSKFYSKYNGPATTLTAQQVISTCKTMFESTLADNQKFVDINELFDWLDVVLNSVEKIPNWLKSISVDELSDRLYSKMYTDNDEDKDIIYRLCENLSDEERSLVYYKNNLIKFISDHKKISSLITNICKNINTLESIKSDDEFDSMINKHPEVDINSLKSLNAKGWNSYVYKELFMDPNNPPDSIKDKLVKLNKYLMDFVYVRYMHFDRVYRIKNFMRKCVTVIDTDSNMLYLGYIVDWIRDNVLCGNNYGRNSMYNDFILVNTITYFITSAAKDVLDTYSRYSNIPEDQIGILNMKNEFLFLKMFIGNAKKRYITQTALREGNLNTKFHTNIAGFDFVKSTTSEAIEKYIMTLINEYMIKPKTPDTAGMLNDIERFKNNIIHSINTGNLEHLPICNAKDVSEFVNPSTQAGVRGTVLWNILNPDDEIDIPSKPNLVKLVGYTLDDIAYMKDKYPSTYDILVKEVFNDTSGIFTTKRKSGDEYNLACKGLNCICVPNGRRIPEAILPLVDYESIINNILAPIIPVLEILGVMGYDVGKTTITSNNRTRKITNMIRF